MVNHPNRSKRARLSLAEINAILGALGDLDQDAHFQCFPPPERDKREAAFEAAKAKLDAMAERLAGYPPPA